MLYRRIFLAAALAARRRARDGSREAPGGRDLLDPRRFREERRRRARRDHHAGRPQRRRARLCPVARRCEEARRGQARDRERAALRGLDRPAGEGVRHQGRARGGEQGREGAREPKAPWPATPSLDPHAWQSVANAKIYVVNIRDALTLADPAGKDIYAKNAADYLKKLDALEAEVKAAVAAIPAARRKIITTHDAFGYFRLAYGIEFITPQGVSTEAEASAQDVARIIRQIKAQKIPAVFLENVSDPRLIKRIAEETGARIGGTLFSDALSDDKGPAPTYIDMMRHNVKQLSAALTS